MRPFVLDTDHPAGECSDVLRELEQVCVTAEHVAAGILARHRMVEHDAMAAAVLVVVSIESGAFSFGQRSLGRTQNGGTSGLS